jgi:8-oxo-dGTP pyrophosphatase MutT (NUDIX family)
VQNERGWDIPGGHLEGEEEPFIGLQREVIEEAGALVKNATPYAVLSSSISPKVMLFFKSDSIELVQFVPSEDALDRALLDPEDLLGRYYGDKDLLRSLIEGGQENLE